MSTSALMDLINKKKQEIDSNNRAKTTKVPDGRSRWRILPGWRLKKDPKDPTFFHDFGSHFIKDAAQQIKAVYVCTEKTFGRPCDVCSTIASAMARSHDDVTTTLLKESSAGARVLLNALHLDGQSPSTPVILELPPTAFNQIIGIMQEWGDILSLTEGKDLIIERTGKGIGTKYTVQVSPKAAVLSADVMDKITNLDEYVAQESEAAKLRAVTQVNAVAGILTTTSQLAIGIGGNDTPTRPSFLADVELDAAQEAELEALMVGDSAPVQAVVQKAAAAVKQAEVAAEKVVEQASLAESAGDELDDLLADLQG